MEKRRKIEAANGEFLLIEEIIQYIQSFLTGKKAAQTSILSKSWYSAWLTRPNLEFDQRDFNINDLRVLCGESQFTDAFPKFAKKTMQRYQDLNLKIQSFRLRMGGRKWISDPKYYSRSLANELIVKAMKLGATELNLELEFGDKAFALPHEVLGSESLIRLSVNGCEIDQGVDRKVSCSILKSLSLRSVSLEGDMIWDIIWSCPLIEELSLSECRCLSKIQGPIVVTTRTKMLALSPIIEFGEQSVGSVVDVPINLHEFCMLKCLLLEKVKIDTLFFCDMMSRFPCLKDLTLRHCSGYKEIQISSPSLECISFEENRFVSANFDVPSIRMFNFSVSCLPSLSFKTVLREWESDISITCTGDHTHSSSSWFLKFKKLLIELSPSKISLSLNIRDMWGNFSDYTGDIQGLPKPPIVESLMMLMCAPSFAFLDGLFWNCRPKFITLYWLPKSCIGGNTNNEFPEILCNKMIEEVSEDCCIPNRDMSDLHDLEEVNVEIFEKNLAEWRPMSWRTLLDTIPENKQKIRFKLRWG